VRTALCSLLGSSIWQRALIAGRMAVNMFQPSTPCPPPARYIPKWFVWFIEIAAGSDPPALPPKNVQIFYAHSHKMQFYTARRNFWPEIISFSCGECTLKNSTEHSDYYTLTLKYFWLTDTPFFPRLPWLLKRNPSS